CGGSRDTSANAVGPPQGGRFFFAQIGAIGVLRRAIGGGRRRPVRDSPEQLCARCRRKRVLRSRATCNDIVVAGALRTNRIKHGVFLQHDCRGATAASFAGTVRGASSAVRQGGRAPSVAAPFLKKISRGLLTVEKTVIRFRPAAVSCGRECVEAPRPRAAQSSL